MLLYAGVRDGSSLAIRIREPSGLNAIQRTKPRRFLGNDGLEWGLVELTRPAVLGHSHST